MILELVVTAVIAVPIEGSAPNTAQGVGRTPCHRVCRRRARWRRVVRPYRSKLRRMAECESGGRWHIATGNGFYGGLQFVPSTWWGVGGRGMPHEATRLEQMYRAVILIRRAGYGPWPICGYR